MSIGFSSTPSTCSSSSAWSWCTAAASVAASIALDVVANRPSAAGSPWSRTTADTRSARATCSVTRSQSSMPSPAGSGTGTNSGAKWSSQACERAVSPRRAAAISSADSQLIRTSSG
jgi:hypothetical protein